MFACCYKNFNYLDRLKLIIKLNGNQFAKLSRQINFPNAFQVNFLIIPSLPDFVQIPTFFFIYLCFSISCCKPRCFHLFSVSSPQLLSPLLAIFSLLSAHIFHLYSHFLINRTYNKNNPLQYFTFIF